MRMALLSDIHGNMEALDLACAAAQKHADTIVCLGDIVDEQSTSTYCIVKVRELCETCVRGNHDDAYLQIAFRTSEEANWLHDLPLASRCGEMHLVHDDPSLAGNPPSNATGLFPNGIKTEVVARQCLETAPVFFENALVAVGHNHVPAIFSRKGKWIPAPTRSTVLPPEQSFVLSPGTVGGKPRSPFGNTFATFDTQTREFTVHRINIAAPKTMWDDFFDRMT